MALRPVPTTSHRTRRLLTLAVAALMCLVGIGWPTAAFADPEGGTSALRAELDESVRGFLDAQAALEASKARQAQLATNLATAEANFAAGQVRVGKIAGAAFRSSGLTGVSGVLNSSGPEEFLGRVVMLNAMSIHEQAAVTQLVNARNDVTNNKTALDTEIAQQSEHLAAMNARKQQAERALWAHGGGQETGGFFESSGVVAVPAPRRQRGRQPAGRRLRRVRIGDRWLHDTAHGARPRPGPRRRVRLLQRVLARLQRRWRASEGAGV
jgi:hypothetical protein